MAADTSIGSVYAFFPNKLALFQAIAARTRERSSAAFDDVVAAAAAGDPGKRSSISPSTASSRSMVVHALPGLLYVTARSKGDRGDEIVAETKVMLRRYLEPYA